MKSALRATALAEWRGLPEPKSRPDKWQAPRDVLPALIEKLGLAERLQEDEVAGAWRNVVGEFIAAHSTPVSLREGVLYVRVLQPSLHYQLETISRREILRRLKQRFGGRVIRDLRFRVG